MSSEYDEQFRQALRVIRKADYNDLITLQDVVKENLKVIKDERSKVEKVEVIEVGYYHFGTLMRDKLFRADQREEVKDHVKKLIDRDKYSDKLVVGYKTILVYPDELV